MSNRLASAVVAACILGTAPLAASAQSSSLSDDSAATTFKLLRAPETPAELWDAIKFMLNVGKTAEAGTYLERLLAANPPPELLLAIREKDSGTYISQLASHPDLQNNAVKLIQLIERTAQERARDPQRIRMFVDYLSRSPQHRGYAIAQLRNAGADAVPFLLEALADPARSQEHATIIQSMQRLDTAAVPPLLAALATDDSSLVIRILEVLGALGDRDITPFLRYLAEAPEHTEVMHSLARRTVERILQTPYGNLPAAKEDMTRHAVRYYEHRANVRANSQGMVRLWRWIPREGLRVDDVTASYAEEYFGMALCRQALLLDPAFEPAQIVMLSLAMSKEFERVGIDQSLPAAPNRVAALATAAGPAIVNQVLARAIEEDRREVILAALHVLARNGDANSLAAQAGRLPPLIQALALPDPRIQFAAAEAVLSMRPQHPYPGTSQVVAILTRAIAASGSPKAIVIDRDSARGSALVSILNQAGFDAPYVTGAREAFLRLTTSPDYELIFIDPNIHTPELSNAIATFRSDPRTAGIPIAVLGDAGIELRDPLHDSLRRGDIDEAMSELAKLGSSIFQSKLEAGDKEDLLKETQRIAATMETFAANPLLLPPSKAFLSLFIGELNRFERQIDIVKSDKAERAALIDEVLRLKGRVEEMTTPRVSLRETGPGRLRPSVHELTRLETRYPLVKAVLRPVSVDMLRLQLNSWLPDNPSKPLTAAERAAHAKRAIAWLAQIARGEIRGIDIGESQPAVLAILADETLGPDAIVVAGSLASGDAQSALTRLVGDAKAAMPLRIDAARQLSSSLRQFGMRIGSDEASRLQELMDRTAEPTFHQALAGVVGAMKPDGATVGQRLRGLPTPAFEPAAARPAQPEAAPAAPGDAAPQADGAVAPQN